MAVRWPRQGYVAAAGADVLRNVGRRIAQIEPDRNDKYRARLLRAAYLEPSQPRPYPRVHLGLDTNLLRPPMVLATFHVGHPLALMALAKQLPGEILVPFHANEIRRGVQFIDVRVDDDLRMTAVYEGVRTLRHGGFVMTVVDGVGSSRLSVDLLGKRVPLSRGAFAMARLARAPILPLIAYWRGSAIQIIAGPLTESADEAEMAARVAAWLERYLIKHPGQLRALLAEVLASAPRLMLDGSHQDRAQRGVADLAVVRSRDRLGREDDDTAGSEADGSTRAR